MVVNYTAPFVSCHWGRPFWGGSPPSGSFWSDAVAAAPTRIAAATAAIGTPMCHLCRRSTKPPFRPRAAGAFLFRAIQGRGFSHEGQSSYG